MKSGWLRKLRIVGCPCYREASVINSFRQHCAPPLHNSFFIWHNARMKNLTATLCLSLTILLGSMGMSASADFQKGLTAARNGDFVTALREWTPLAQQGSASAQYNLGLMYQKGDGVSQDYATAVKFYRLASEQGHAVAQFNLGTMYDRGIGVSQNDKTALKWYRLSAEKGYAKAQYNLGVMYENGQGVLQKYKTAVKWYKLASEQGYAKAQGNLGTKYAFGLGVLKDYIRAHMWGNIAAMNGHQLGAKLRDDFEKKMTPVQIAEAQKLARECVRKKYKGC